MNNMFFSYCPTNGSGLVVGLILLTTPIPVVHFLTQVNKSKMLY